MTDTITDIKGPTYSLPRFDDWQAKAEWKTQLEADVYVENFPVGREVYLSGRVSWRTNPGQPDSEGWRYAGDHLYRVTVDGGPLFASSLDPTDKMRATVRDAIELKLEPPSDTMRIATVQRDIRHRQERAEDEYKKAQRDTLELSERFATAMGLEPSEVLA